MSKDVGKALRKSAKAIGAMMVEVGANAKQPALEDLGSTIKTKAKKMKAPKPEAPQKPTTRAPCATANSALRVIRRALGNPTTTETQLQKAGRSLFGQRLTGVFATPIDPLPAARRQLLNAL